MPNFIDAVKMNGTTVIDGNGNINVGSSITFSNGESIKDENGNEQIKFSTTTSAVNEVTVKNAATGNNPSLTVTGGDTNIGVELVQKGTAPIVLGAASCTGTKLTADQPILDSSGNELVKFTKVASAVNEITIANAATGNGVSAVATGGDTNIEVTLSGKGTGAVKIGQATSAGLDLVADQPIRDSSSNEFLKFTKTTDAVNEFTVVNAATGNAVQMQATGGDTDIALNLVPKGTGKVQAGGVEVVTLTGTQILTNKTLTSPTLNTVNINLGVAVTGINLGSGDVTLNATQASALYLEIGTAHATNAVILPTEARFYFVKNADAGTAALLKKLGGNTVSIAATKTALIFFNGTDYVELYEQA